MATADTIAITELVADLERARAAFSKSYGKRQIMDAVGILDELQLSREADIFVRNQVIDQFKADSFAGFLRYDGIVQSIEIELVRQSR